MAATADGRTPIAWDFGPWPDVRATIGLADSRLATLGLGPDDRAVIDVAGGRVAPSSRALRRFGRFADACRREVTVVPRDAGAA